MRVDFSEWHIGDGLVARSYQYTKLQNARDFQIEIHFTIQSGMTMHTFFNIRVSEFDADNEQSLQGSLSPMNGIGQRATMTLMVVPDRPHGVILNVPNRQDVSSCVHLFREGKDLLLELRKKSGELLLQSPLPNNLDFKTAYDATYSKVQASASDTPLDDFMKSLGARETLFDKIKNLFR